MNRQKIAKVTFVINFIALIATIILRYLLLSRDIQLTWTAPKIFLFTILHLSTIYGLYISLKNKLKPLITYFLILVLSPIVFTIGCVISGQGIIPLYFAGKFITSTFGGDEKVFEKDNISIKKSPNFFSIGYYDLVKSQGLFEKKIGQFNAGEDHDFTDFKIFDSINKKYIKLTDSKMTLKTYDFKE